MTHRTIHEWGRIPVGRKDGAGFTVAQAEALVAAARAHPLGGEDGAGILTDHRHFLRARGMVGVLAAPGCSLEILPKVDPETAHADDALPSVRANLVTLLDLALGLNLGDGAAARMARLAPSLLDILIRLFAEQLLAQTRRGLPRQYLTCEDDLPTLRGRLDAVRQFTANAVRPDRLASRFDVLSHDIPLMQIMAAAVVSLGKRARAPETRRLLDELRFVLADVTLPPHGRLPWARVAIDRSNRQWASLLALARLLLGADWQATGHEARHPSHDGTSLLFPMEKLFEDAVAALLRRALPQGGPAFSGIELVAQGGLLRCLGDWTDGEDCTGRHFQTVPDLLLRRKGEVLAVIDTKWKRLAGDPLDRERGVKQADVYQMMAYSRLYRCERLMLLYPALPGTGCGEVRRFGLHGGTELLALAQVDVSAPLAQVTQGLAMLHEALLSPPASSAAA